MDNNVTESIQTAIYNTIDNILLKAEVKSIIGFVNVVNSYYLNSILSDTAIDNIKTHVYDKDQDIILDFIMLLINNLKYELGEDKFNSLSTYYINTYNDIYNSQLNTKEMRDNVAISKNIFTDGNRPFVCVLILIKQHIKHITTILVSYENKLENMERK